MVNIPRSSTFRVFSISNLSRVAKHFLWSNLEQSHYLLTDRGDFATEYISHSAEGWLFVLL